jgi:hypothetical protein
VVVVVLVTPVVVVVAEVATFTTLVILIPVAPQLLPLEQAAQKELLQHRGQILVFTRRAERIHPLELHSLPSVVVVAEATKEGRKTDTLVVQEVAVPINQVRQILDLVVPELQVKDSVEEIHAAVAVVKSLAAEAAVLAVLVLVDLLVDVVVVVVDHSIQVLAVMVYRILFLDLQYGTPVAEEAEGSEVVVETAITFRLPMDLVVDNQVTEVADNVKLYRVISKQKMADLVL